jgi:hypothetical protein
MTSTYIGRSNHSALRITLGLPLGVGCGMIASTLKTPRNNDAA